MIIFWWGSCTIHQKQTIQPCPHINIPTVSISSYSQRRIFLYTCNSARGRVNPMWQKKLSRQELLPKSDSILGIQSKSGLRIFVKSVNLMNLVDGLMEKIQSPPTKTRHKWVLRIQQIHLKHLATVGHLKNDRNNVARSWWKRWPFSRPGSSGLTMLHTRIPSY